MGVIEYRSTLEQLKGKKDLLKTQLKEERDKRQNNEAKLHAHEKARQIIKEVAQATQEQLTFHISDVTTLAMESVFDDPYSLEIEFVQRRNKMECDLFFVRDGERLDPLDSSGVGHVDIASFALRIASWSLSQPAISNIIILDEPFKHLKGEKDNKKALQMIQSISHKLHIQIIMVSDERIDRALTTEIADNLFEVKLRKGISKILIS